MGGVDYVFSDQLFSLEISSSTIASGSVDVSSPLELHSTTVSNSSTSSKIYSQSTTKETSLKPDTSAAGPQDSLTPKKRVPSDSGFPPETRLQLQKKKKTQTTEVAWQPH